MSESFNLEIISPENIIFKSDVIEVTIPAFEGLMSILKDHIPLVTFLRPGFIQVKTKDSSKKFYIEEGTVEFTNNQLLILSSSAKNLEYFKKDKINEMILDSKKEINNEEISDKERYILSYKIETLNEINL
ncbi:MAG: ATP synthase F1 subunit epsilon [Pelagibacteraceae bacterium TMED170]|nr:MAG: ATP synthase F1 subunit epsilon [Pelagibacteraceae bacterium TMED170]